MSALVADASAVLDAFAAAELQEKAAQAVALLALVAGQDVEPAEGSDGTDGRWQMPARSPLTGGSTVDPDSRHVHKSRTAARTAIKPTWRSSPAPAVHRRPATKAAARTTMRPWSGSGCWTLKMPALDVLGDTAYGTGQARADLAAAGHTAIIKPAPLRPAVPGGSPSTTSPPTSRLAR